MTCLFTNKKLSSNKISFYFTFFNSKWFLWELDTWILQSPWTSSNRREIFHYYRVTLVIGRSLQVWFIEWLVKMPYMPYSDLAQNLILKSIDIWSNLYVAYHLWDSYEKWMCIVTNKFPIIINNFKWQMRCVVIFSHANRVEKIYHFFWWMLRNI